ncbi:MAG: hypothetical protein GY906_17930 [bacterium]|nr:hypothetical protein [bacterium]
MRERDCHSLEQVGMEAGFTPVKAGKSYKNGLKYGHTIWEIMRRIRNNGATTTHRDNAAKIANWLGLDDIEYKPTNTTETPTAVWLEVSATNGKISTDILYRNNKNNQTDIQQLCEIDGYDEDAVRDALMHATMWAQRLGLTVDNMTKYQNLNRRHGWRTQFICPDPQDDIV